MRKKPTPEEAVLWSHLEARQMRGKGFRRQFVMLGWIADFYCPKARLIVELDGAYHDPVKDGRRDRIMAEHGFTTLRFENWEVRRDLERVLATIAEHVP